MIKISAIIPIYNAAAYLPQCLNSICAQTLKEIQIICVDDGSEDQSYDILEQYAGQDSRILLLRQDNQYAGRARNKGMSFAIGKYLAFLDADDFYSPAFLEEMYRAAEGYEADVVICRYDCYHDRTKEIIKRDASAEESYLPANQRSFNKEDAAGGLFQCTNGWAWDKIFRADYIREQKLQFQSSRTANDGYFVYMALANARVISQVDAVLVTHRIENIHSLSNTREKSWHCGFQMLYDIKEALQKQGHYRQLEQSFMNFALKYIIWHLENLHAVGVIEESLHCIQNECKEKLGITSFPEEYYYDPVKYEKYKYAEQYSVKDYLWLIIKQKEEEISGFRNRISSISAANQDKVFLFPFSLIDKDSSIVLYGAGKVGQDYYQQITGSGYCHIVLWMDQRHAGDPAGQEGCGWLEELECCEYDKLLIALRDEQETAKVKNMLVGHGVPREKIL